MLELLRAAGTPRSFDSASYLFKQGEHGDGIFLIDAGHVKIEASDDLGSSTVLGVRGPGDLVGEFAAVTDSVRSANVVALEPVRGYVLDGPTFLRIIGQDSSRMLTFMRSIIAKLHEADRRRADFGSLTVERRMARMLVELADDNCDGTADNFTVPLSQQDLAAAVGASRQACAKAMRRLRGAGIVDTRPRATTILDLERLRHFGEVPRPGRRAAAVPSAEPAAGE
jgi:CRP/FNR family transcriptional regulator, cyclic AMP receptor protein